MVSLPDTAFTARRPPLRCPLSQSRIIWRRNCSLTKILHGYVTLCFRTRLTLTQVTFRLLSREQGLHVNVAKKCVFACLSVDVQLILLSSELATYFQTSSSRDTIAPTYLLSGIAKPPVPQFSQDSQGDVDMDGEPEDDDGYGDLEGDTVSQFKVVLAGEKDFQSASFGCLR